MEKQVIKIGDKIRVILGSLQDPIKEDTGTLVSIDSWAFTGFSGIYKSDTDGKEHVFDQTVHFVKPI